MVCVKDLNVHMRPLLLALLTSHFHALEDNATHKYTDCYLRTGLVQNSDELWYRINEKRVYNVGSERKLIWLATHRMALEWNPRWGGEFLTKEML